MGPGAPRAPRARHRCRASSRGSRRGPRACRRGRSTSTSSAATPPLATCSKAHGFRVVRTHLHMVRDLGEGPGATPGEPPQVVIRPMREGDEHAVHHVVRESFAEHFATHGRAVRRLVGGVVGRPVVRRRPVPGRRARRRRASWAWRATSRTRASDGSATWASSPRGAAGGSARALLAASFDAFRARGLATARLNVDAENETGAADLYRAVGMREHRRFLVFEKPLREG